MQPHQTGLKVRCRSTVASAPKKWWAREDLHLQGSQTLDLRGLLFPLNHSPENYSNWSLLPVLPRHDCFTKEIHRLLQGGVNGLPSRSSESVGWSQSPVLPWAQRAYETCLSAGSTAVVVGARPQNWSPHPELHRAGFHTKEVHRSKCLGA